jgi:hypothetical protein
MWWLVWELCKYLAVYAATGLLILALPGEPPRWLQFTFFLLVALSLTIASSGCAFREGERTRSRFGGSVSRRPCER